MKIVNLTKNNLTIISRNGKEVFIPSTKEIKVNLIRDGVETITDDNNNEIRINKTFFIAVKDAMKEFKPIEGTIYIVSPFVYACLHEERTDIYVTDEPVKSNGVTTSCKALSRRVDVLRTEKVKDVIDFIKEKHANMVLDRKDLDNDFLEIIVKIQNLL